MRTGWQTLTVGWQKPGKLGGGDCGCFTDGRGWLTSCALFVRIRECRAKRGRFCAHRQVDAQRYSFFSEGQKKGWNLTIQGGSQNPDFRRKNREGVREGVWEGVHLPVKKCAINDPNGQIREVKVPFLRYKWPLRHRWLICRAYLLPNKQRIMPRHKKPPEKKWG